MLVINSPGTIWFNLVSLFPPTWHHRPNGNRIDLMQKLDDMKPGFLRFPGGNYLEGSSLATRFPWKETLGDLTNRPGHTCCWGYRSSDGMGLLEFLEWAEDLKAQPVLAVYAGYSLPPKSDLVKPGADLQPYVADALNEIEYVIGDTSTKWGARRAADGHPAPFKLNYVEIGNEDWFDESGSYDGRFTQFYDAIKAKYPQLQCISTVGNEQPEKKRVHSRKPDVLDEHYYRSAENFEQEAPSRFERYDRNGPKIFVGEWAAYEDIMPWSAKSRHLPPTPNLKAALADAAWMTGMERNSDLIVMQCYAPMLVNVNPGGRQWRPDLVGYNALNSFGSPSYYAMAMFNTNRGNVVVRTSLDGLAPDKIAPLDFSVTMSPPRPKHRKLIWTA
jgi:alpha-N-arabinofuranosidase